MLCNRSPRRWATVCSSLFLLTLEALGATGAARVSVSLDDAAPAQAAQSASAATQTGAPVIVSVPFERTDRGELLPNPEAVKTLLAEADPESRRLAGDSTRRRSRRIRSRPCNRSRLGRPSDAIRHGRRFAGAIDPR